MFPYLAYIPEGSGGWLTADPDQALPHHVGLSVPAFHVAHPDGLPLSLSLSFCLAVRLLLLAPLMDVWLCAYVCACTRL